MPPSSGKNPKNAQATAPPTGEIPTPLRLNLSVLDDAVAAVDVMADCYASPVPSGRSPAGVHMRHVLDHYASFFRGLDARRVDYYARDRDESLERNPDAATRATRALQERLVKDVSRILDLPIQVATGGPGHEDGESGWADSTVRRELAFLVSHTLHHLAMIRMIGMELGIDLGGDLGVAHSTLAYRAKVNDDGSAGP